MPSMARSGKRRWGVCWYPCVLLFLGQLEAGGVGAQQPVGAQVIAKPPQIGGVSGAALQGVRMPLVRGLTEQDARVRLEPITSSVSVTYQDTSDASLDQRVLAQKPDSGAPLRRQGNVSLLVARVPSITLVSVPDITGQDLATALQQLRIRELRPGLPASASDQQLTAIVSDQDPRPRVQVPAGSVVLLTLRPPPTAVPSVVGIPEERARWAITSRGLTVGEVTRGYSDTYAAGIVTDQNPRPPANLGGQQPVQIHVSLGPHEIEPAVMVPSLYGLTVEEARDSLRRVQLNLGQVSTRVNAGLDGRVLSQTPLAESGVHVRDRVNVVVGVAPPTPMTHVPDVLRLTHEAADRAVRDSGLVPVATVAPREGITTELLVAQSPPAGNPVPRGSTVTLRIFAPVASETYAMPPVVGLLEEDARNALAFISTAIAITSTPVTAARDSARVLGQDPAAGAPLSARQLIRLVVGRYTPRRGIRVPGVTALTPRAAVQTLVNDTLDYLLPEGVAASDSVLRVLAQSPAEGEVVDAHTPVMLTVDTGDATSGQPARTTVPQVLGMTLADARAAIVQAHLTVGAIDGSDTSDTLRVIRQVPDSGISMVIDSPVDLVLGPVELAIVRKNEPTPSRFWWVIPAAILAITGVAAGAYHFLRPRFLSHPAVSLRLAPPDVASAPKLDGPRDSLVAYDLTLVTPPPETDCEPASDLIADEEEL